MAKYVYHRNIEDLCKDVVKAQELAKKTKAGVRHMAIQSLITLQKIMEKHNIRDVPFSSEGFQGTTFLYSIFPKCIRATDDSGRYFKPYGPKAFVSYYLSDHEPEQLLSAIVKAKKYVRKQVRKILKNNQSLNLSSAAMPPNPSNLLPASFFESNI